jgi:hypothetical protein
MSALFSKVRLDMVAMYREPNLEVIVTPHPLLFWEWQVQGNGDLFNSGFSSTRWKARYDGNALRVCQPDGGHVVVRVTGCEAIMASSAALPSCRASSS